MNTLSKLAMGIIGQIKPLPAVAGGIQCMPLVHPQRTGGMPLMEALNGRHSQREFAPQALDPQTLSNLIWAACGINRIDHQGRTMPSAMNAQEVLLYVAMPQGLYLYIQKTHSLQRVIDKDVRPLTGNQDFVDTAPLDLIYVADHSKMKLIPAVQRTAYASTSAGAMAQNVYLYCASAKLATVVRAWFDRDALSEAMGLEPDLQLLLSQTVGAHVVSH